MSLRWGAVLGATLGFMVGAVAGCATANPNDMLSGWASSVNAFAGAAIGGLVGLAFVAVRNLARRLTGWRESQHSQRWKLIDIGRAGMSPELVSTSASVEL